MPFSSGLAGTLQKAQDFLEYGLKRTKMKLDFARNRRAHRRIFRGVVGRILVVRLGSLGDVVRATAIVRELRALYPAATIDVLTSASARDVLRDLPGLNTIYTIVDLARLGAYDWVINLQNPVPLESFLDKSGLSYRDVLQHLSTRLQARMISGRHLEAGLEVSPTDIHFCLAEMEELFLTALLDYDSRRYPRTSIHVSEDTRTEVMRKFGLAGARPLLGVFLGTNSVGRGADEGYRTYSIAQVERICSHFLPRFRVAVFGQAQMKTPDELTSYRAFLAQHPDVIDLVDKTTLDELIAVMDRFSVVVTCDSSPVHIALARGVPVVGLYVNDATFRLGPHLENDQFIAINSTPPCFYYSSRWKFFCQSCRDPATRAHYCHDHAFVCGVDSIPLEQIDRAVTRLLTSREAACRT